MLFHCGRHGKLIKLVAEVVVKKLKTEHRPEPEHLVGIDYRVVVVRKLLDIDFGDVRFIQIYGIGGIYNNTLAGVVFNPLPSHFAKCCFLKDFQVRSSRNNGVVEPLAVHGGTRSIDEIEDGMKRIGKALSNNKVLVILDDVDDSKHVEKLVGKVLCIRELEY